MHDSFRALRLVLIQYQVTSEGGTSKTTRKESKWFDVMDFENLKGFFFFLRKVAGKWFERSKRQYFPLQIFNFSVWERRSKRALLWEISREIISLGSSQVYVMATM